MLFSTATDESIRDASRVILLDSERDYYEPVGETRVDRDSIGTVLRPVHHLTILVDSRDLAALNGWRERITRLRLPTIVG
jgi:hypothetical protein